MESKKRYNKKFLLVIAVLAAVLQLPYFSSSDHTEESVAGLHAGSFQSAALMKIKPAVFVRAMIADPVNVPVDFDNRRQEQIELLGDTSGEGEDVLAETVKAQQVQLDLLKKENERLSKEINGLSNCLDVQQENNSSLEKRVKSLEKLKAKFAKKILGL